MASTFAKKAFSNGKNAIKTFKNCTPGSLPTFTSGDRFSERAITIFAKKALRKLIAESLVQATGGIITTVGAYRIHTFLSSGTFQLIANPNNVKIDALVVAAGGGTGGQCGGGGGGGGVIIQPDFTIALNSFSVTIGNGVASANGQNSVFSTLTAIGGGVGGGSASGGGNGGSGGGGGWYQSLHQNAGNGTAGQGYAGAATPNYSTPNPCSGGGGAGEIGHVPPNQTTCGNGGIGRLCDFSGTSVYYGGGGAGGFANGSGTPGAGGLGGGGNTQQTGQANTGGGSGGFSGAGGSGIVIIRYLK